MSRVRAKKLLHVIRSNYCKRIKGAMKCDALNVTFFVQQKRIFILGRMIQSTMMTDDGFLTQPFFYPDRGPDEKILHVVPCNYSKKIKGAMQYDVGDDSTPV